MADHVPRAGVYFSQKWGDLDKLGTHTITKHEIHSKCVDTFKVKTLVIMTFPPKFLDWFKIKVLNPLKTGQQSQNAFRLFVKESFSFFSMTRPAFQRLHPATLKLLASPSCSPRERPSRNSEEGVTSRLTVALQGQTQKEKIRTAATLTAKLPLGSHVIMFNVQRRELSLWGWKKKTKAFYPTKISIFPRHNVFPSIFKHPQKYSCKKS